LPGDEVAIGVVEGWMQIGGYVTAIELVAGGEPFRWYDHKSLHD